MTVAEPLHFFEAVNQVAAAPSFEAALAGVAAAVQSLGFARYALVDRKGKTGVRAIHHNAPGAWPAIPGQAEDNPIIQRAMASPIPFAWGRELYVAEGAEDLWEAQAAQGFGAGICAAYGPNDAQAFIVIAANGDSLNLDADTLYQYFGNLLMLAGACLTALPTLAPATPAKSTIKLRPRELECLHWAIQNKTAWEIGVILGISERTVNQHLARARSELGVANTKVAATRAFQLDLLPRFAT